MVRITSGTTTKKKHKKVLKAARGYWMTRHKQFRKAKEAVLHAGAYAFSGRKIKKREFRKLWIIRLNAAVRELGLTYNRFRHLLKEKKIELDRKILARIATEHPKIFEKIIHHLAAENK